MGLFTTVHHTTNTPNTVTPYEKTVHEHRAPTDESIKNYEEILEKSQSKILGSFKTDNNVLSLLTLYFSDLSFSSIDYQNIKYFTKFTLNNKEYKFEFTVDFFEAQRSGNVEDYIVRKIVEKISFNITKELLEGLQLKDLGIKGQFENAKLNF